MNGLSRRRGLLLPLALALPPGLRAASSWKVYGSTQYAPFSFLQDGRPSGQLVERLNEIGQRIDERFDLELLPWPRAMALAGEGGGGLLGVSWTAERAIRLDYSLPLMHDELRIAVRADSRLQFRGVADLRGLRVGMVRGATGGKAFDDAVAAGEFQLIRDWNAPQRLRALLAGRLDAAVMGSGQWGLAPVLNEVPELARRRAELRLLEPPLLRDALHLAFPKALRATALLRRFDAVQRQRG